MPISASRHGQRPVGAIHRRLADRRHTRLVFHFYISNLLPKGKSLKGKFPTWADANMATKDSQSVPGDDALAIAALSFIAGDAERLGRFLAVTGLGPGTLREAAARPDFLAAILDYLSGDETLLVTFAANAGVQPEAVVRAQHRLSGADGGGEGKGGAL